MFGCVTCWCRRLFDFAVSEILTTHASLCCIVIYTIRRCVRGRLLNIITPPIRARAEARRRRDVEDTATTPTINWCGDERKQRVHKQHKSSVCVFCVKRSRRRRQAGTARLRHAKIICELYAHDAVAPAAGGGARVQPKRVALINVLCTSYQAAFEICMAPARKRG